MNPITLALANLTYPDSVDEAVSAAEGAVAEAARAGADVVCFPECFVPGYRGMGKQVPPPDQRFLDRAWASIADAARQGNVTVVLGTERIASGSPIATVLVMNRDGSIAGFQDKVQIDPSEDGTYLPGTERRLFACAGVKFGVAICHEAWRYPETVRWAARRGAQIVFHPHFHQAEPGSFRPTMFADPANTFHEKAMLCRAAENTCFFASVNYASDGSPTTSAIIKPDGTVQAYQPYGRSGLLVAEIDPAQATGLLASRCKY